MRVAVIIVNYKTPQLVITCLAALAHDRALVPELKAVVVDNASPDGSAAVLAQELGRAEFAEWVEFRPLALNGGFGWGNNQAMLALFASSEPPEAVLLLNPDTEIRTGAVAALVRDMAAHPDAGAVGSQLINLDGELSGSAFAFPSLAQEFQRGTCVPRLGRLLRIKPDMAPYGVAGPVDWVTGASVLLRAEALRQVGLFDTGFFLYFEEVELMRRLDQAGWKRYHCPDSQVVHIEGASTGVALPPELRSPTPDFVQASRDRYFALAGGPLLVRLADMAWIVGDWVGQLVKLFFPTRRPDDHRRDRAALRSWRRRVPLRPARPAVTRIGDPLGQPPAWMG